MQICMGALCVSCARMRFRGVRTAHIHETSRVLYNYCLYVVFDTFTLRFAVFSCESQSALEQTAPSTTLQTHTDVHTQ